MQSRSNYGSIYLVPSEMSLVVVVPKHQLPHALPPSVDPGPLVLHIGGNICVYSCPMPEIVAPPTLICVTIGVSVRPLAIP